MPLERQHVRHGALSCAGWCPTHSSVMFFNTITGEPRYIHEHWRGRRHGGRTWEVCGGEWGHHINSLCYLDHCTIRIKTQRVSINTHSHIPVENRSSCKSTKFPCELLFHWPCFTLMTFTSHQLQSPPYKCPDEGENRSIPSHVFTANQHTVRIKYSCFFSP